MSKREESYEPPQETVRTAKALMSAQKLASSPRAERHILQVLFDSATQPLLAGLDTPKVPRRPLAVDVARYAGEWVAAVVADTRALAEDAAELVRVDYQPLPFVLDGEAAYASGSPIVHADHGSNVLLDRTFVWGEVEKDFAESPHRLSLRLKWGRSSTVPVETFAVLASWDPWREVLDVYASVQMPRFPDQVALALKLPGSSVRVHNDVDVGGSYGVKRGIKHAVLVGYLSRRLGFPVRLVEDRLENMRAGDGHGPERNFDIEVAFDGPRADQAALKAEILSLSNPHSEITRAAEALAELIERYHGKLAATGSNGVPAIGHEPQ